MDLFTYLLKKKGHNSSVNGDLFSYLLASRKRGTYQTYTGTQINVNDSINARMKNWILGGNSNQNGTPTPDAPIDIHNVIGENNVIENSGKNLYEPILNNVNLNGLTPIIENDGSISVTGICNTSWSNICANVVVYMDAGTYTFSVNKTYTDFKCGIRFYENKEGKVYEDILINAGETKVTKTFTSKIYGWRFFLTGITPNTEINENFKVQVEVGSQATPFEKYKGKNYKISLASKNLLNLYDKEEEINGVSISIKNGEITLNGTATSTFQIKNLGVFKHVESTKYQLIFIYEGGSCTNYQSGLYLSDNPNTTQNVGGGIALIQNNRNAAINDLGTKDYYLYSSINNGCVFENYKVKVQIIEGETPDYEYAPFTTSIIELCKIGDYQDKIYKSNDKWLLEKNVGKAVLNGSMNWFLAQTNTNTLRFGSTSALQNGLITNSMKIICNNFPNGTGTNDNSDNEHIRSAVAEFPNYLFINIDKTRANDLTTFENWLNNNQTIVYYITNAPVITEITDDNLIEQLEQLSKARSFDEQTNITQLSEQLPFDLTVDIKTL